MSIAHTFTGPVSQPLWRFRADSPTDPIVPDAELTWLRENPQQVARIRRVDRRIDGKLKRTIPTFAMSVRILDPREAEGWRVAFIHLPGNAPYNLDSEETLDAVWRSVAHDPFKENDFVLTALNEAVYTGEAWAEAVLRSLVLPDLSGLDPKGWGQDFTPCKNLT